MHVPHVAGADGTGWLELGYPPEERRVLGDELPRRAVCAGRVVPESRERDRAAERAMRRRCGFIPKGAPLAVAPLELAPCRAAGQGLLNVRPSCPACGLDLSRAVPCLGKAGSITVHHVRAVHGSATNFSGKERRFLLFQYRAADAWPLLDRALEIDPNHGDTLRRVADCYLREGKLPEAQAAYRRAVNHIPFPDSLFYLSWGLTLEQTGNAKDAASAYKHAAVIDPQNNLIKNKLTALNSRSD